ncbi:MAG: alpha-ketoglutarate-dependent dioxygenase AlkB [Bacteroidota bacterium]
MQPGYPDGFSYSADFITAGEEQQLLEAIADTELHALNFRGFTAKRRVASYGYDYNFDERAISKGTPIPQSFHFLVEQVAAHVNIPASRFAELLLTHYPQGSVINWHRDAPPFGLVAGISLLSDCTFRFRPYAKAKQTRGATIAVPVLRKSLYIIDGPARSDWEHSIAPVGHERYSITLRTLRNA